MFNNGFTLSAHKADCQFEGNFIIVWGKQFGYPSLTNFQNYLCSRDAKFPLASPLWLILTLVMGTGNPWVKFYSPAPVPAENPSRVYGYGFPIDNPTGLI